MLCTNILISTMNNKNRYNAIYFKEIYKPIHQIMDKEKLLMKQFEDLIK